MKQKARIHILVSGLVQGVFFRANTKKVAKSLGLTGWVRNLADGRVEILAEGKKENLEKLKDWANHGPENARVERLTFKWLLYQGEFSDFKISEPGS